MNYSLEKPNESFHTVWLHAVHYVLLYFPNACSEPRDIRSDDYSAHEEAHSSAIQKRKKLQYVLCGIFVFIWVF